MLRCKVDRPKIFFASDLKGWDFAQLSQHRFQREITVGICHRLPAMARHSIQDIYCQPLATSECLQTMTPRMIRRNLPRDNQGETAASIRMRKRRGGANGARA
jgi:hypothetical protein